MTLRVPLLALAGWLLALAPRADGQERASEPASLGSRGPAMVTVDGRKKPAAGQGGPAGTARERVSGTTIVLADEEVDDSFLGSIRAQLARISTNEMLALVVVWIAIQYVWLGRRLRKVERTVLAFERRLSGKSGPYLPNSAPYPTSPPPPPPSPAPPLPLAPSQPSDTP